MNSVTNIFFDFFQVNKIAAKFLTCSKSVSNHLRSSHLLIAKTWIKIIESKMAYSESELDSNFVFNSMSDFDSDSDSESESESNSVFMNLVIFIFFVLYLHSSK